MTDEHDPGLADLERRIDELLGPFYDRQGNPMSWAEWSRKKFSDGPERDDRVGLDTISGTEVSTVWLGLPSGEDRKTGKPLIFETMVTRPDGTKAFARYTTETEAEAGHRQIVADLTGR